METTSAKSPATSGTAAGQVSAATSGFIAPADQISFGCGRNPIPERSSSCPNPGSVVAISMIAPSGSTQIDRVEILAIVRTRDMQPTICETPLPLQQSIPGGNVERKMAVRSGSPAPFWIADPGDATPAEVAPGSTNPASGIM